MVAGVKLRTITFDTTLMFLKNRNSFCLCIEKTADKNGWLENDGVEQEQTYIPHPITNFNVYDM